MQFTIHRGNCIDSMRAIPDNTFDSIVTDPPYELGFMGKGWDASGIAYSVEMWSEALRILKPGGHLLAFSGSRTYHRMACAIEDAGFEVRDQIMWVYGSGFPKSLDVSKAIDKQAGAQREVLAERPASGIGANGTAFNGHTEGATQKTLGGPVTPAAQQWDGWGTALKPAHEPICVARKPLKGTVVNNVLAHGTGGINIAGCRVGTEERFNPPAGNVPGGNSLNMSAVGMPQDAEGTTAEGRWPANLIHDGHPDVVALFPDTGKSKRNDAKAGAPYEANGKNAVFGAGMGGGAHPGFDDTSTSAARFFYCAKASKADRDEGLEDFAKSRTNTRKDDGKSVFESSNQAPRANIHPTVKPTALMQYLVRLVTPPGGLVLDPFTGSGSTGKACMLEGFRFVGCELSPEYAAIAEARIEHALVGDLL